jgi:hypothetical protein
MFQNKVVPKFSARLQHQRFFLPLSDLSLGFFKKLEGVQVDCSFFKGT